MNGGNYKAVFFEYDQLKRVTAITDMLYETKESPNGKTFFEKAINHQYFKYHNKEQLPYLRRVVTNDFDEKTGKGLGSDVEDQIFLFKNGIRIGDSIINYPYRENNAKLDITHATKTVTFFKQTASKLIRVLDFSEKDSTTYVPPNIYSNSFEIDQDHNIRYESAEHNTGGKFYPRTNFTFTKFDKAINPLQQLNIAPLVSNEKISLSFETKGKEVNDRRSFDYGDLEVNWHFLNQNNPMNYSIERGETETPLKDLIQLSYTYNQYHQPIYCKTIIKKVMNKDTDHKYDDLTRTFKKSFTFRYMQ
ncbi:MAG: hypothetical protein ABL870_05930 [Sediminibacterium sp.]